MRLLKAIPFAASILVLQAQTAPVTYVPQPTSTPLYRVIVVQGSAHAINYRNMKYSTHVDMKGTVLSPDAVGEATMRSQDGAIRISLEFKKLPAASSFGGEFLTYVLWGISPEGRATNLGELLLKDGRGKLVVSEQLQTFGLVVTAEPYFAVSQPSDVVVMENSIGKEAQAQVEFIDAKYELLKRGQYTLNLDTTTPFVVDDKTLLEVLEARNAVRIAYASGASSYAADPFAKAAGFLQQAESDGREKNRIMMAREAVQRAEDARLIAVQRQQAAQLAMDQKAAQDKLDAAKAAAASAAAGQDIALQQNKETEDENAKLRSKNEGLQFQNQDLRSRLMEQLNAVLQTRATARGLIVNMSGVLFQNGKATLVPAAREKLAKIAGILSAYKGLKVEADGFTDSTGSDSFNQSLSEQRAGNAKDYLVSQGVSAATISSQGFGKESPIASNDTASGRQENRRVELVVTGEGITTTKNAGL